MKQRIGDNEGDAGSGAAEPASTPPASAILLIRDGANGLEVFMQQRYYAPGETGSTLVFPGDRVVDRECAANLRVHCHPGQELDDFAVALRATSIRTLFEDTGVLLARRRGSPELLDGNGQRDLAPQRDRMHTGSIDLCGLLQQQQLELAGDQLIHYAHWLTPAGSRLRFDTHFFLAPLPAGQCWLDDGQEPVDARWIAPKSALRAAGFALMFPTHCTLRRLALANNCTEALAQAAAAPVRHIQPQFDRRADGLYLQIPAGGGYPACEQQLLPAVTRH